MVDDRKTTERSNRMHTECSTRTPRREVPAAVVCRKQKVLGGKYLRCQNEPLRTDMGYARLKGRSASHAWVKA